MSVPESVKVERALLADGVFCLVAGLLVAARSRWLVDAVALPAEWPIVAAGVLTVVWGMLLVAAARFSASKSMVRVVAVANGLVVLVALGWIGIDGASMSGAGLAVVVVLTACVLGFAVHQTALRRGAAV